MDDLSPIAMRIDQAEVLSDGGESYSSTEDESQDIPQKFEGFDIEVIKECSLRDPSDTDNAERLMAHFGRDLTVLAQDGVTGGDWLAWTGTHWDIADGAARARMLAQKVGLAIKAEAMFLALTPKEQALIEEWEAGRPEFEAIEKIALKERSDEQKKRSADLMRLRDEADAARQSLKKRKKSRRDFGISSRNGDRIRKMLEMAEPHMRRSPDAFNRDRLRVATTSHTLVFRRHATDDHSGLPNPALDEIESHDRDDLITACVPFKWQGWQAEAPKWHDFLSRMLPDPAKLRTVQQFAGLGLTAIPLQYLMFHYGTGANGKSVFLETITRVLGPGVAVSLPRESIVGSAERGQGAASPDIVRLYGKRMVRISEIKADVPLQEDLVKRLTGGESFAARSLFKAFFEFQNVAKPHMSGNGFPTIDGTDNGVRRRLLVVHWDQVIPESERRDLEEMVSEFVREEAAGILAWLAAGVIDYLQNGLVVADSVRTKTDDYFDEMDPIGEFIRTCVRPLVGNRVQGGVAYQLYQNWSTANGKRARSQTKFGRMMGEQFAKKETGGRTFYENIDIIDIPSNPATHDGDSRL